MPRGPNLPPQTRRTESDLPPVPLTAEGLALVQFEPLRPLAAEALGRAEPVLLLEGSLEDGARVETLVFPGTGRAAQSTGSWVFEGLWSGTHVLTLNGHALDRDGACFCRACDRASGFDAGDED